MKLVKRYCGSVQTIAQIALVVTTASSPNLLVAQNNSFGTEFMASVQATVTGQLKTRNHIVTIYASPTGPLYTVVDVDGNVKGVQMSAELLARRFPVLKSIIESPADGAGLRDIGSPAPADGILF